MPLKSLKQLDSTEGTILLRAVSSDGHLILHPAPNPLDPNDSLRWPKWKKYTCFTSVSFFAFMTNYAIGGMSPAFYPLSIELDRSMTETSHLLLWPILVLGVPMASYFGKRPIFLFSTLLLCLSYLWGAVAQSFQSLLWSNIIAAFAGSASEALADSVVNDLFFTHERANLMGWYMNAICGGNTIGPLICGFVITRSSWRVHKWHSFGLVGLNFLDIVLFFPETRYNRPAVASSEGSLTSVRDIERSEKTPEAHVDSIRELSFPPSSPVPTGSLQQISKKTYLQEVNPWSGLAQNTNLLRLLIRPLPLIVYPAVILAFLGFAVSLAWVVAINILNSFVLQAAPYNFPPSTNVLINITGLIGNLIGAFIGGWVVDKYSDWCSRRNRGIFQPETRLHLLVVPTLIVPAGCLAWGYGVARSLHWTCSFFANGMVGVGLTAVPTMTMTHVSDSYLPINADALTVVMGLKNVVAFGFLYGIVPWGEETGYIIAFGTQAGVYVLIMASGVPMVIWGRQIRHRTASWRITL